MPARRGCDLGLGVRSGRCWRSEQPGLIAPLPRSERQPDRCPGGGARCVPNPPSGEKPWRAGNDYRSGGIDLVIGRHGDSCARAARMPLVRSVLPAIGADSRLRSAVMFQFPRSPWTRSPRGCPPSGFSSHIARNAITGQDVAAEATPMVRSRKGREDGWVGPNRGTTGCNVRGRIRMRFREAAAPMGMLDRGDGAGGWHGGALVRPEVRWQTRPVDDDSSPFDLFLLSGGSRAGDTALRPPDLQCRQPAHLEIEGAFLAESGARPSPHPRRGVMLRWRGALTSPGLGSPPRRVPLPSRRELCKSSPRWQAS
jgi:hypothetical protein